MTSTRAGFWRRLGALILDCIVLTALVQAATLVLYPLTGGHVQAEGYFGETECTSSTTPPAGITVPPGLDATGYAVCRHSLYGIEHSHTLAIERVKEDGNVTTRVGWSGLLDAAGNVIPGVMLDVLILPILMLGRAVLDGRGRRTPGRWLTGVRVATRAGQTPAFARAMLRQLYHWLLPMLLTSVFVGSSFTGHIFLPDFWPLVAMMIGATMAWLIWILVAAIMLAWKRDTLADRLSGAVVVIEGTAEDAAKVE